ncbi:MAG: phage tail tube protein [Hyphomicrobium sp.]|jgi:hypothetical protein
MTATAASIGYSTLLKKGDGGSPEAFTDYGLEITSIDVTGVSRSAIDATHMASPNGYTEMIFGIKTQKPFNVEVNWVPTNTAAYQALLEGSAGNWRVQFPDNSTVTVYAGITDVSPATATPDGKLSCAFTFTPSGKATWA